MAMKTLTHFFLGLTNEWLESMSTMLDADKTDGSSQGGACRAFDLCSRGQSPGGGTPGLRIVRAQVAHADGRC